MPADSALSCRQSTHAD